MRAPRALLAAALALGIGPAAAQAPAPQVLRPGTQAPAQPPVALPTAGLPHFALPIRCTIGEDCWIVQYVDRDPGPGWQDYACGKRSYDGHKGTDFGVRDMVAVARGVPVLAAAPGRVLGVRDELDDARYDAGRAAAVKNRECGNGVVIDHGGGWNTQYCHMRRGSVAVHSGQEVRAGDVLGAVGMSGMAEFPHMHFEVRWQGRTVDPFTGADPPSACRLGAHSLWDAKALPVLQYSGVDIQNMGIAAAPPDRDAVLAGTLPDRLAATAPALIVWAEIFAVRKDDALTFTLRAPDGKVLVEKSLTADRDRIRQLPYVGVRRPGPVWPTGTYRAEVTVERRSGPGGAVTRTATWALAVVPTS